jgi:hypothetical protein
MRKYPSTLVLAGILVAVLATGAVLAFSRDEPPPKPVPEKKAEAPVTTDDVAAAVGGIIDRIFTANKGVRLGMPSAQIPKLAPGAAEILDEYYLPLEGSTFAPKGNWTGTVKLLPLEKTEPLDEIHVALLVGKYDRAAVLAWLRKKAKAMGIEDFARDTESGPWTWWGTDAKHRDLWIGLGEGVIAVEVTQL